MSKAKRKRPPAGGPAERRSVEALTIGWMLSVMTTLVCGLGAAAARLYLAAIGQPSPWIEALAAVSLFAAAVVGLISLLLAWAVVSMRQVPPPRGILVFGVVVGAAPLVAMLARVLF